MSGSRGETAGRWIEVEIDAVQVAGALTASERPLAEILECKKMLKSTKKETREAGGKSQREKRGKRGLLGMSVRVAHSWQSEQRKGPRGKSAARASPESRGTRL